MKLIDLLKNINFTVLSGQLDQEIKGIYYDSRRVTPGSLFICISGFKTDGHLYVSQAVENGAIAVLVEKEISVDKNITCILTANNREIMPQLAANYYQEPTENMRVIGVTGTNGKTTITHLIKSILDEAGKTTGIIGTLYARINEEKKEYSHTTPEAFEIEEFMNLCREKNSEYIVMEASSHALDLHRVDKIHFNIAILSNISQDHLDYHQNIDNYKQSKIKLFRMIPPGKTNFCIVNADDACAQEFINACETPCYTYGLDQNADIQAENLNYSLKGTNFNVKYKNKSLNLNLKLIGLFSVYNALAAVAFALKEGISPKIIKSALEKVKGVPGRFEQVDCGQDFTVIVDYAHTPDGLENILKTGKQIVENRLITVFGCGGDRDKTKRPQMGEIAARYSDFCIITTDNPRSEEPENIIHDIVPGLDRVQNSRYAIVVDRREAIRQAFHLANKGDIVMIAGKGHETYQLVKDQVLDFDDRLVAREILKGLK